MEPKSLEQEGEEKGLEEVGEQSHSPSSPDGADQDSGGAISREDVIEARDASSDLVEGMRGVSLGRSVSNIETSNEINPLSLGRSFSNIETVDYPLPAPNQSVIDRLTYGTLAHFLPEMQKAKSTLGELTENQRILIETIQQENGKFGESEAMSDASDIMERARLYRAKLVNIKREMVMLHDKSAKLKKRALKLQQHKQKEALQREQEREHEAEKERQLMAKMAKPSPDED